MNFYRMIALSIPAMMACGAAFADTPPVLTCHAETICHDATCADAPEGDEAVITIGPEQSRTPEDGGPLARITTEVSGAGAMLVMEGVALGNFLSLTLSGEDQRLLTVTEGRLFYSIHREANTDYGTPAGVETIIGTCRKGE